MCVTRVCCFAAVRCPSPAGYGNMRPKKGLAYQKEGSYHFGNIVYYECDVGFVFYGNKVARCQANGRWSRVKGKCARISCGKPSLMAADEVVIGNSYLFRDSLRVLCPNDALRDFYELKCEHTGHWLYVGDCHSPEATDAHASND